METLSDIFSPTIEDVEIKDNPIVTMPSLSQSKLLTYFLIAKLPVLKFFNGQIIDDIDRQIATKMMQPLLRIRCLGCLRSDLKLQSE